jgi:hypothetical protein
VIEITDVSRFGGAYCHHLQGQRVSKTREQQEAGRTARLSVMLVDIYGNTWIIFYSRFHFLSLMQQINNINSHLIYTIIVKCIKWY